MFVPGIDPLYAMGSNARLNKIGTKADAGREFASIFVSQMLKEAFKSQSSMLGEEEALGMFSENLYNEVLLAKLSSEIAKSKSFDFDKLMKGNK